MTATQNRTEPGRPAPEDDRRAGELNLRELTRFAWRQLTSMRTALVLLLMLALAAVPGSLIPQERLDSLKTSQWQDQHETLTPVYERIGLFNVYSTPWFAAIYILLVISLVGCILPRTFHYLRALGAQPPRAPRYLTRMPAHAAYGTRESPQVVIERVTEVLRRKHYRLRAADPDSGNDALVLSAEKGYLRELGNLIFHLAVLVVLVGFATGSLFGYKGGVIVVTGDEFSNTPTQYDDFVPGSLFQASWLDPFRFTVDSFDIDWLQAGPRAGTARGFNAHVRYVSSQDGPTEEYDLRVNHPLTIDKTDLFLIGHGYAPIVTVKDGDGNTVFDSPQTFLPQGPDFFSFGVIALPDAQPGAIGLEGFFYPSFANINGDPVNLNGQDLNPLLSLNVWTGDLGLDSGVSQSVYVLDKSNATALPHKAGMQTLRIDLTPGQMIELPDGLGSVTFDGVESWQRIQISQSPGKLVALCGVLLALLGLMGSLFIRSRRIWVRVHQEGGRTVVEVAGLDRSGGADTDAVLSRLLPDFLEERR